MQMIENNGVDDVDMHKWPSYLRDKVLLVEW